ncbi:hypothetical protein GGD41_003840 [Paraburkholderia bryophila]|uniref:Uncharacterized protein n=1 Tax=Paraburkholderia bryophila TaxID=420952 RepID=A0A7Z0B1P2_9BURK|nr:hypothetical protein [Paraburkholderia bryophila]
MRDERGAQHLLRLARLAATTKVSFALIRLIFRLCMPGTRHADISTKAVAGSHCRLTDSTINETPGGIAWLRTLFPY